MKYKKCIIYITSLFMLYSCGHELDDNEIFNGKILVASDKAGDSQEVHLQQVPLDGTNYGYVSAYDSLMLFMNPKLGSHFFNVFHIGTGTELGQFVNRGLGKDELISVGPAFQLFEENEDIKTLLFAPNEEKILIWNITQSLNADTTIIDKYISCPWRTDNYGVCYGRIFRTQDALLMKVPAFPIGEDDATLPYYKCYNMSADSLIREYTIYKQSIKHGRGHIIPESFFDSNDAIKPDGTKIVQAMTNLPQLNIIDLKTGDVIGYRLEGSEDFSIFQTDKKIKTHFVRIHADDNYIYTVYWGKDKWGIREIPYINTIYIFDWNGNLVRKLETDYDIDNIFVNASYNQLYVTRPKNDDVYSLDLTSVLSD